MKKKIVLIVLTIAMIVSTFCISAFAAPNGSYAHADRSKKGSLVVIGDSRIYGIYKESGYGTDTSYSAVWGGHYGFGKNIISDDRQETIKTIVQNTIKRKGKCRIVLEGTINDVGSGSQYDAERYSKSLKNFAKKVSKWSAKHDGKTVKPVVYVTEALPSKSGAHPVAKYNKELKNSANDFNYTYINLKNPESSDYADDLHFKEKFKKEMHADIKTKAK